MVTLIAINPEGVELLSEIVRGSLCKNCSACSVYSRGICRPCWLVPEIRVRFERISRRGIERESEVGNHYSLKDRNGKPTDCLPGTEGKIRVLMERAARGLHLWHPLDAGMDGMKARRLNAGATKNRGIERLES